MVCWELFARSPPWVGRTACQITLDVGGGTSVRSSHVNLVRCLRLQARTDNRLPLRLLPLTTVGANLGSELANPYPCAALPVYTSVFLPP
eukprot:SAG22_NODE_14844_length_363_cov_1.140152_1_plen_89_part_01